MDGFVSFIGRTFGLNSQTESRRQQAEEQTSTETKVDLVVKKELPGNWEERDYEKLTNSEKWKIVSSSKDYRAVWPGFISVKPTDVYMIEEGNPCILAPRNFNRFGISVTLPPSLESYFAYGICPLEEAEIIFFADSNHALDYLVERRIGSIADFIHDDGILFLEGLDEGVTLNAQKDEKNFKIRGWEREEFVMKGTSNLKSSKEELVDSRNDFLLKLIAGSSGRVLVYLGEGHVTKALLASLDRKFVVIYDREILFAREKSLQQLKKDYYFVRNGTDLLAITEKLGIKISKSK